MTYWELFRQIEQERDLTKCGIACYTLNLWIDNIYRGSGKQQSQEMQKLLEATKAETRVKHYRVWEKDIFVIAETTEGSAK